jgi:S-methylmethionine-dependent homocysteine/selenocysteine methylase
MKHCDLILLDGSLGDLVKQRLATLPPSNTGGVQVAYKDGFSNACYATLRCPDIVREIHHAYVNAGCDVLTTNSFGCSMHCLRKAHIEEYRDEMVIQSRILAQQEAKGKGVLVAGSLPPLSGEDCYIPNRSMTEEMKEAMKVEYEDLVRLLYPRVNGELPVDILLCETMATSTEAICAALVCTSSCPRVWVSFTLDDTLDSHGNSCRLRGGESLEDAVRALLDAVNPLVEAVLVNCCSWIVASAACKALGKILVGDMGHIRYGAYANGFITTTREWLMKEYEAVEEVEESRVLVSHHDSKNVGGVVSEKEYADHVMEWISHGATIVGGCCGIGPNHIKEMKERMKEKNIFNSRG